MPDTQRLAIQVAKVEEKLTAMGENIRDDIREIKENQEEQWRELRKFQATTVQLLHSAETERAQIRNDTKGVGKLCNERFEASEKNKKTRMTVAVLAITGFFNIAIEAGKKWL